MSAGAPGLKRWLRIVGGRDDLNYRLPVDKRVRPAYRL